MEKHPIIQFNDFGFQYRSQSEPTLYHIDLSIYKGEKVLIVGPSGCGKSTLAHCMNGLIPASYPGTATGSFTIAGKNGMEMSLFEHSKTVGTVLQDTDSQFIALTVAEDIAFAMENSCVDTQTMHRRTEEIAKLVGVSSVIGNAPTDVSGGQKQRVSLGGVLVNQVDVLLFDEPLANLDPATGKHAISFIDEIQAETGCAVVIIEHRLEDVLYRRVDRIVVMGEGRILYEGDPDTLLISNLLCESGIREPLYVTALKYAGVSLAKEMHPSSLEQLKLPESVKQSVQSWFHSLPSPLLKTDAKTLLKVDNIHFTYPNGKNVLKGISLSVQKGEMLSIVGTNGAGKSTFSKVICGFETPQTGAMIINGQDIGNFSIKQRADLIGYVMQNPNQMISQTMIYDEVAFGLRNRGFSEGEIEERVLSTLKICGLYPFRKWPISALSYGQKKRVTIASILVLNPEILILDEPTAGQDFRHYTEIMDFLKELNKRGVTVMLITHDMHLMLEYTQRAVVFHDGNTICDTSPALVLNSPEIVQKANLKETSLYHLALLCGIDNPEEFTRRFIEWDKEVRK